MGSEMCIRNSMRALFPNEFKKEDDVPPPPTAPSEDKDERDREPSSVDSDMEDRRNFEEILDQLDRAILRAEKFGDSDYVKKLRQKRLVTKQEQMRLLELKPKNRFWRPPTINAQKMVTLADQLAQRSKWEKPEREKWADMQEDIYATQMDQNDLTKLSWGNLMEGFRRTTPLYQARHMEFMTEDFKMHFEDPHWNDEVVLEEFFLGEIHPH